MPPRIKTILCFGDSLMAGYGLASSQAFPALLQLKINAMRLPYQVVNAGVNGDTSAKGVLRIEHYLHEPIDVLLLELGINDLFRGILPNQTAQNLQRIVDRVKEKNPACRLVLAGMEIPPSMLTPFLGAWAGAGTIAQAFGNLFREMAHRNGMAYVPFLLQGVAGISSLNQRDGIHPTADGQRKLAETVWDVLSAVL